MTSPKMSHMNRKCGIKGCVEHAVPAAFVEFEVWVGRWITARVEVCETHYDSLVEVTV